MSRVVSMLKAPASVAIVLFIAFQPSFAQRYHPVYDQFVIGIKAEPEAVPRGGDGILVISIDIPIGFTLTDDEGVFGITPAPSEGIVFGELEKPEHDEVDEDGMGHWWGVRTFRIPIRISDGAGSGERKISLDFILQACEGDSCKLPARLSRSFTLGIINGIGSEAVTQANGVTPGADETEQEVETEEELSEPGETREADLPASAQEGIDEEEKREESSQSAQAAAGGLEESFRNWLQEAIDNGYLWLAFVVAFGAGILTSLTPCVYPMIPITISYVSGRAQGRKSSGFLISLVLVLGIVLTYSALGVFAALAGQTFGAITQNLFVQGFILVVLVVMGLSMLGAFELGLPAALQQKMQVRRQGYAGALFVGLTLGFVAAPCVAPILIPILALIATAGDLLLGVLLMIVYALGMGVLFVLVGTFSAMVLPKSGEWMVWLKRVFAFVLFLMAIYFAQDLIRIVPIHENLVELVTGSVLVLFGVVVGAFFRMESDAGWWRVSGKAAGILLLAAGLILFSYGLLEPMVPGLVGGGIGLSGGEIPSPNWIKNLEAGLEQAEREGKPVLIDFWADWCKYCNDLDRKTFSDSRVIAEIERFVAIKVDGSDISDEDYLEAVEEYDVLGLPTVIFMNSSGAIVRTFNSFQDADSVLSYLKAVE